MDFPAPAFRQVSPPPSRDAAERTQKERDEASAQAFGFGDARLDAVNVSSEQEAQNLERKPPVAAKEAGRVRTSTMGPMPPAPSAKARSSSAQPPVATAPDDVGKARLAQVFARIEDHEVAPRPKPEGGDAPAGRSSDAEGNNSLRFDAKLSRFFNARNRSK